MTSSLAGPPNSAGRADLVIRAKRVVLPDGIRPAEVHISGGQIIAVLDQADTSAVPGGPRSASPPGTTVPVSPRGRSLPRRVPTLDLPDDEVLMPGLVDTHVHVNEPGRTHWEGFATATAAAAAGGVTTIIDMPLNSIPPTVDTAALERKRHAAAGQCSVDVGFWGGAIPANLADRPALHAAGVFGFKCFLVDSGVPEFPPLDDAGLAEAMRQVAELGSLLIVHAEDAAVIADAQSRSDAALGGPEYGGFLRTRPPAAEVAAIARVIGLARMTGARVHILHLSAADAVPMLAAAQADGVPVTAETCPHYLALAAEEVGSGATQFKCCPPIREAANRTLLWAALGAGVIGCVVSDHSPCPPELKCLDQGDFGAAWGGISSVQLGLPVIWTQARERGYDLADVARWMAAGPASLAGLISKGAIAAGLDADLIAFAPDEDAVVDPSRLRTRHQLTPYAGQRLTGRVRRTWLRGSTVLPGQHAGRLIAPEGISGQGRYS
jgi:allantoinase